jgi:hypothetical protein
MKAFKNANRSVQNGLNRMTAAQPILQVRTHARRVRRNDRNPIWNMLTAPEIKVFRIQSSGATIPVIMHAMIVYRKIPGGSKRSKVCILPSSRKVSSSHAV